jgi:hypothetical protein
MSDPKNQSKSNKTYVAEFKEMFKAEKKLRIAPTPRRKHATIYSAPYTQDIQSHSPLSDNSSTISVSDSASLLHSYNLKRKNTKNLQNSLSESEGNHKKSEIPNESEEICEKPSKKVKRPRR